MARVTLYVPEELLATARAARPDANLSALLQAGLRGLLGCEHAALACSRCGHETTTSAVEAAALERFYRAVMGRLREHVDAFGTVEGAARLVRTVALAHGVAARRLVTRSPAPPAPPEPAALPRPWCPCPPRPRPATVTRPTTNPRSRPHDPPTVPRARP